MKNRIEQLMIVMLLVFNGSAIVAMDKPLPEKSISIFSKAKAQVKNIISSKPKSEKATQELVKLLNSKKDITVLQVQPLIEAGADINAIGADGKSLLNKAVAHGKGFHLVEYAIQKGVRPEDGTF